MLTAYYIIAMSDSERNMSEEEEGVSESESMEEEVAEQGLREEGLLILQEQNDKRCATYVFNKEDHTLGNLLRTILSGHADVEFVGYSIPHPSEPKMNLRLQTLSKDTNDVLNEGLRTVQNLAKTLRESFMAGVGEVN
jgi:DNA-directed RNA polymerase I and III subunit RPAC2